MRKTFGTLVLCDDATYMQMSGKRHPSLSPLGLLSVPPPRALSPICKCIVDCGAAEGRHNALQRGDRVLVVVSLNN